MYISDHSKENREKPNRDNPCITWWRQGFRDCVWKMPDPQ